MYLAPYIQDDWKVNSKLTLNLGLRYDYRSVPYETNDHMGWRNLNYAPGGLLVADPKLQSEGINDGQYYQAAGRRNPENPDRYKVFAPRLGFAYRPGDDEKTVIRGGWGRFYDSAEGREIDGAADIYPYVSRGNYSAVADSDHAVPDHRPVVPELLRAGPRHSGRQHLPRREHVPGAQEPLRRPVVPRRAAAAHEEHRRRAELRGEQGATTC